MKYKNLIKAAVFMLCSVLVFSYIYKIFSWKDTAGGYTSAMDSLKATEDDLIDVVFLGSSHCYAGIDNSYIWDHYGIANFSMAISGQDMVSSYHSFKEVLKTQSPKVVCLEMFGATFEIYGVVGNLYRNTLSYPWSKNFYEVTTTLVEEEEQMDFLLKWPIIHTRYRELQRGDFVATNLSYRGYFSDFVTTYVPDIKAYQGDEKAPLDAENEEYLYKIIELAKEENIELIFFTTPYEQWTDVHQKQYNTVMEIAKANDIPFFNMNMDDLYQEIGLDGTTDFRDATHISRHGAKKISKFMGEYLAANYDLEDMRGDERYYLWDEFSDSVQHDEMNQKLRITTSVEDYFALLTCAEDYTVVITTIGNYGASPANIADSLESLGIADDYYNLGGTWVIDDMETAFYTNGLPGYFYHHDLGKDDLVVTESEGNLYITYNLIECMKGSNGITIWVYDNIREIYVDCVYFDATEAYKCYR